MSDRPTGQISENSRRIAKNTLALYFRMFLLMAIGLYTSRVVLNALGETDFGVYGAVGGVVSMCSLLTGSLASAISRFLTVELGKNDEGRLKDILHIRHSHSASRGVGLCCGGTFGNMVCRQCHEPPS